MRADPVGLLQSFNFLPGKLYKPWLERERTVLHR